MNNSTFHDTNISSNRLFCHSEDADWPRVLETFAVFFVGGCGIFGNIFIIVLAVKYTVRRNLHHLIINMAVVDTLVVLTVFCLGLPQTVNHSKWYYSKIFSEDALCKVYKLVAGSAMNVSYYSLVIISIERFRASRQTVRISQPYTLKQRLAVVAFSWIISLVFMAFEASHNIATEPFPGVYMCQRTVPIVFQVIHYIVFLSTISCAVTLSIVTLRRISRRQEIEASLSAVQRKAREKRIASAMKMVLSSLLLHLCAYVPFFVLAVVLLFLQKDGNVSKEALLCLELVMSRVAVFLPLLNSCLSPVIYLIFLADFREAARKVLKISNEGITKDGAVQQQPACDRQGCLEIINQSRRNSKSQVDSQKITTVM